jgi:hypothetical protein
LQSVTQIYYTSACRNDKVEINPEDFASHPDWYEKLFVYLQQVRVDQTILGTEITADNKNNYRTLLQWIGGYFLYKLDDPLLWYKVLLKRANAAGDHIELVAMNTPRHPAEAEFIQQAGGKVLKIDRPGLMSDTTDVTERHVAEINADAIITNDGSLTDLKSLAQKVHDDLLQNRLRPSYTARSFIH